MADPYLPLLIAAIAVVFGFTSGLAISAQWETFLLWRNRVPFGERDAQFGRDVAFYVFELPFLPASAEATSQAVQAFYEKHQLEEFDDVHPLMFHVHAPGLFHMKGAPIQSLEDLQGKKIRAPTRVINDTLGTLGATPVGMPVPQVPEALSTGVISGTTIPWEVTPALKVAELVRNHTGFSGTHGLYTQTFAFTMNLDRYNSLPDDLKALIDQNAGVETARAFGATMDAGDAVGLNIAQDAGNNIVTLDEAETQRWKEVAQATIDNWYEKAGAAGFDGKALHEAAKALVGA
jgi:TRAP-type C4-dicarboxylate transport system substrate-binding protein